MFKGMVAALVWLLVSATHAGAQSTAVTYQGELKSNGTPADGLHDFRFRLFDAASGGTQLGTTLCLNNVPVTDGKFTATIDFGQQFASTSPRFLEIDVRADFGSPCTDVFGYVAMTPRQALAPAPRATAADVANALAAPDGSPANAVFVDNAGNVGIGSTSPGHSVTIAKPAPTIALQDTDSAGTAGGQQLGFISYRDSGNVEQSWIGYGSAGDPDFSILNVRPSGDIVLNPVLGNVGIGTQSPTARLDVRGDIRLGASGQLSAPGGEETLRIVRGIITENGLRIAGTGFTSVRIAEGRYSVTFNTPFSATPTVTATADRVAGVAVEAAHDVITNLVTPSTLEFLVRNTSGNVWQDRDFQFIAFGPR